MTELEIRQAFSDAYNGQPNFMTPLRVAFRKRGPVLVELSSGSGISGGTIWGVTCLEKRGGRIERRSDLNGCFGSREAAEAYIRSDFDPEKKED